MITTPEKIIWRLLIRVHFQPATVQLAREFSNATVKQIQRAGREL